MVTGGRLKARGSWMSGTRAASSPAGLGIGIVCAVGASLATKELGLWAGALAGAWAVLYTLHRGRAGPWLLAFPAALAATAPPPGSEPWPRAGPVRVEGIVLPGIRRDPPARTLLFRLARGDSVLLCASDGLPPLLPGDRVSAIGRLGDQLERRRQGRVPLVQIAPEALQSRAGPPSLARLAAWCRHELQDSILELYRGRESLLLTSLVLGRGIRLPDELAQAHRATGLSHLLAVSGAHASILAWVLALVWATWAGRSPLGSRSFRRSCAILLLFYGAVTGLDPPVFRALAAWLLALAASSRGRRMPLAGALGLPALLTVLIAPSNLVDVGFILSYAAVFGLSLAAGLARGGFWRRWVLAPLVASFWATATTAPITLWAFGQLAPWTILATPLLAPLVVVMLAGGLVSAGVGCFAPAPAALMAAPVQACTWLYCEAVNGLATLPGAPILALGGPGPWEVAAVIGCGLLLLCWLRNRWGVLGCCLLLSAPHLIPRLDAGPPRVQLLAVGHGLACLAHLPDRSQVLVDCGSLGNPRRAARQVVEAIGPRRILDLLIVSHGDGDHAGGIPELVGRLRVRRAILPSHLGRGKLAGSLARAGVEVSLLAPGQLAQPRAGVQVYAPELPGGSTNDRSLWVRLQLGAFTALVTGDSQEAGTRAWLLGPGAGPADLLVLPHHGRDNASAAALLEMVRPSLALVSNREGEGTTAQAVLARRSGIPVLLTGNSGTITVLGGNPPVVRAQLPLAWK